MRTFSLFLSFFCFIISYANSQTSEWSGLKVQTEILIITDKFSQFLSKIDELKRLSELSRISELKLWKIEADEMKKQLSDLSQNMEKTKNETNSMRQEVEALRGKLRQEVNDGRPYEEKFQEREKAMNREMDLINQELSELIWKDVALEKSVSVNKYHIYSRIFNEFYKKKKPDFTWTIEDIKNKTKEANFTLLSEVFPLKSYSFGARAKLTLDEDDFLEISLAYKDIETSGTALNLELIPEVRYTYNDVIRDNTSLFDSLMQYDVFSYAKWILPFNDIANDTISIDIRVEAPEEALKGYSYDGVLTWAIGDFRRKRRMEERDLVQGRASPNFYTSLKGYRVRADAYLDGGQGLTIAINFLTGPYDADLSASFKHRTTVTLFHPTDPTKVIIKSVDRDLENGERYTIDVGTHAEVENILDGDTLYYRIEIIPIVI